MGVRIDEVTSVRTHGWKVWVKVQVEGKVGRECKTFPWRPRTADHGFGQAEAWGLQRETELREALTFGQDPHETVAEYLSRWLTQRRHLTPATWADYEYHVGHYVLPAVVPAGPKQRPTAFGALTLSAVTRPQVKALLDGVEAPRAPGQKPRTRTMQYVRAVLHAA